MFWGGFGHNGTTPLTEIKQRSNSTDYLEVLENNLLRCSLKLAGRGWIFQHDNASIHASASTRNWLEKTEGIEVAIEESWSQSHWEPVGHYDTSSLRSWSWIWHIVWAQGGCNWNNLSPYSQEMTFEYENRIFKVILNYKILTSQICTLRERIPFFSNCAIIIGHQLSTKSSVSQFHTNQF